MRIVILIIAAAAVHIVPAAPALIAQTIDQVQKLTAPDAGAFNFFGSAVSISGDTAVIGAKGATVGQNAFQGAAYVYQRSNGQWIFQQRLVWDEGYAGVEFGTTVAIRGDTIMVGVPKASVNGNLAQGRVIVFRRIGSSWYLSQTLTASDGSADDEFGLFISISGDTAMIGAPRDDVGANNWQGSAYVFARTQNGWFQRQKLIAPDGAPSDTFGNVSLSGETAVIGAFQADIGSNADQGAAYVFTKNGGTWSFAQKLTASDGLATDWLGFTVNIYGGTIVASAYNADINSTFNQGAAYIFSKNGGTWTERQKITVADDMLAKGFQVRTINYNTIVAQAVRSQAGPEFNRGMSYVFDRAGTGWQFRQRVEASDGSRGDGFGFAAEIFGNTILYGSLGADLSPGDLDEGAAYVFEKDAAPALIASMGGRVFDRNGRGAHPARVSIEDNFGNIRYAPTNPFGYYRFKDVQVGSEYTLRVANKKALYNSRTTVVESDISGFDFAALP
jgi:hypothetical protein